MNNDTTTFEEVYTVNKTTVSFSETFEGKDLESIRNLLPKNGYYKVFIWTFTKVIYCATLDEAIKQLPDEKKLVELRIFNKDEELYVWRTGDKKFTCRWRKDGGERTNPKLIDDRKSIDTKMKLRGGIIEKEGKQLWFIKTRNYIGGEQAQYIDSRFVELINE